MYSLRNNHSSMKSRIGLLPSNLENINLTRINMINNDYQDSKMEVDSKIEAELSDEPPPKKIKVEEIEGFGKPKKKSGRKKKPGRPKKKHGKKKPGPKKTKGKAKICVTVKKPPKNKFYKKSTFQRLLGKSGSKHLKRDIFTSLA